MRIIKLAAVGLVVGCGVQPRAGPSRRATNAQAIVSDAPGYQHVLSNSKFRLGAQTAQFSEMGWNKIVGTEGVFATDPITGAVRGNPNGDAPGLQVAALTSIASVHNARVINYFLQAGIPADQVAGAHVLTIMEAGGAATDPVEETTRPHFVAYISRLDRVVSGIPVPDSFAWARFNANDEVVDEAVYWPPIPGAVIERAVNLKSTLADPTAGQNYLASIKASDPGLVVIRHTSSAYHGAFQAFESYDVPRRARGGLTAHYDMAGQPFMLPAVSWTNEAGPVRTK